MREPKQNIAVTEAEHYGILKYNITPLGLGTVMLYLAKRDHYGNRSATLRETVPVAKVEHYGNCSTKLL